jgi:sugar phosphate isomerase/epimerase
MELGCCCPLDQAETAHKAGFDYLECPLVSLLPEQDENQFAPVLAAYQAAPLPVLAFNIFLPGDLKVVGPAVDRVRVQRYVESALARARRIGADLLVFGSGTARLVPDRFDRAAATEQLVDFLRQVADAADANRLTIAIEPLNRKESNIINSVGEAVDLAVRVARAPIRVLADFYHMDEEGEPLSELSRHRQWLTHIHVADSGRRAPGTGDYPYASFANELRLAGYAGRVSVECRWGDFAGEAGPAMQFLRRVFG